MANKIRKYRCKTRGALSIGHRCGINQLLNLAPTRPGKVRPDRTTEFCNTISAECGQSGSRVATQQFIMSPNKDCMYLNYLYYSDFAFCLVKLLARTKDTSWLREDFSGKCPCHVGYKMLSEYWWVSEYPLSYNFRVAGDIFYAKQTKIGFSFKL